MAFLYLQIVLDPSVQCRISLRFLLSIQILYHVKLTTPSMTVAKCNEKSMSKENIVNFIELVLENPYLL